MADAVGFNGFFQDLFLLYVSESGNLGDMFSFSSDTHQLAVFYCLFQTQQMHLSDDSVLFAVFWILSSFCVLCTKIHLAFHLGAFLFQSSCLCDTDANS